MIVLGAEDVPWKHNSQMGYARHSSPPVVASARSLNIQVVC